MNAISTISVMLAAFFMAAGDEPALAGPGGQTTVQTGQQPESGAGNQVLPRFDQWAEQQRIYSKDDVANMRARIVDRLEHLSPQDAAVFSNDMTAKIETLSSPNAKAAEQWLAQTLAVASDSYARDLRARLPDPVNDSPGKVAAEIEALEAREANLKQVRQGADRSRQIAVRVTDEDIRRQSQANTQARNGPDYGPPPPPVSAQVPVGGQRAVPPFVLPYSPAPAYPFPYPVLYRTW